MGYFLYRGDMYLYIESYLYRETWLGGKRWIVFGTYHSLNRQYVTSGRIYAFITTYHDADHDDNDYDHDGDDDDCNGDDGRLDNPHGSGGFGRSHED